METNLKRRRPKNETQDIRVLRYAGGRNQLRRRNRTSLPRTRRSSRNSAPQRTSQTTKPPGLPRACFPRRLLSYGDYVRSGAIFARMLTAKLGKELRAFIDAEPPNPGHMQRLPNPRRRRLTPGLRGRQRLSRSFASIEHSARLQMRMGLPQKRKQRQMHIHKQNPTRQSPPNANCTRRRTDSCSPKKKKTNCSQKLIDNDMVVLRYCDKNGDDARRQVPNQPQRQLPRHRRHLQPRRHSLRINAAP